MASSSAAGTTPPPEATSSRTSCATPPRRSGRLPDPGQAVGKVDTVHLGFDPAVSAHFHVFVLLVDASRYFTGVDVYSSETGGWIHKDKGLGRDFRFAGPRSAAVFLNGYLHFQTICGRRPCIAVVDTKGESWLSFDIPCSGNVFLDFIQQLQQGRLHYVSLNTIYNNYYSDIQLDIPAKIGN